MASIGALVIDLVAKTGSFETDLGRAARAAEKRSRDIDRSISRLGGRIAGALGAVAAAFSFRAIIDETSKAETALAKLDNAVRNNAGAAGFTTQELADLSSELQRVTTYGDDTVQEMQSLLLTFRQISGPEFKRAQVAVLDIATALGQDLNSAARLVGRALADPVRGLTQLTRVGIVLEQSQVDLVKRLVETGRLVEAQGIVLGELESRFMGTARAARDTFGGAIKSLQNAFGDLLEVKGGMPEAVANLNQLTDLLQDPATVSAIDSITSALIRGFTAAAGAIAETTNVTRFWAEELAARVSGPAIDDVVRMGDEIERIQKILESNPWTDSDWLGRGQLIGEGGIKWWSDDELRARMAELRKRIDDALSAPAATGAGAGAVAAAAAPVVPSEEFVKLSDRLKEQIALYGKVGEAAKISYAIQTGALDDLSESEQKEVLALARRYDALVQSAEAQKKIVEEQTRARESIDNMVLSLQQQVATFGQGEESVIAYRIAHGDLAETFAKLGDAAEPLKEQVIELTRETERLARAAEDAKEAQEAQLEREREAAAIWEATRTPLERYNNEIQRLNELRESGAFDFDPETYSRGVKAAQDALEEATRDSEAFGEQFKDGIFGALADGLGTAMSDGAKKGWEGFYEAGIATINRLVAVALAKRIAESLFGDGSSSDSGSIGSFASALGSFFGGGRATGGPVSAGVMYRVNEREPEFFKPNVGGKVIPLSKMAAAGGRGATINQYFPPETARRTINQAAVEASRRQRIAQARLG